MGSKRARRGRQHTGAGKGLRQLRERRAERSPDETPPGRAHPRWCDASHHQASVDYDRDCPVCMAELTENKSLTSIDDISEH